MQVKTINELCVARFVFAVDTRHEKQSVQTVEPALPSKQT